MVPTAFKSEYKQTEYLVEWNNIIPGKEIQFEPIFKFDTWEPIQHLQNCNTLIQRWEQQTKRQ